MFETLDIAIGLVLVFTLVSLICSVLSEWLSGILAMRGQMLWNQAAQKWVADHPTLPAPPAGGAPASLDAKSLQELKGQLTGVRDQLAGLDVPLSPWTHRPASQTFFQWLAEHLTGFLLAALAASLGAPFWFDLLNRFVNLRAAGKKPEPQTKTTS